MRITFAGSLAPAIVFTIFCPPASSAIQPELDQLLADGQLLAPDLTVRAFRENDFEPRWRQPQIMSLVTALGDAREHGLDPDDYHFSALRSGTTKTDRLNILATDAFLSYAGHLANGKVKPITMETAWSAVGRQPDLVAYLEDSLVNDVIRSSLDALGPQQPRYRVLKAALKRYRKFSAGEGWGLVPHGESLKPGMRSSRVPALRSRLLASGDIDASIPDEVNLYDDQLVTAVKRFQHRSNLEPDGVVGPATLKFLNLTPQDRVDRIRVNLERWRWLPEDLGDRHIRVNIADYRLETHEGNHILRVHDVIVGRNYRQTPVFSENMTYLVLNPWWETPRKLARLDKLPVFQKSPQSVEKLGFQVLDQNGNLQDASKIDWRAYSATDFPFRLRQKPGPHNALGRIKFMLPNRHDVYLHDTPSRELFDKTRRDFSSGCIRVKDPVDLAEWVLQGDLDWPRDQLEQVIDTGKETRVTLKQPVPIHLLYWTVVSDNGSDDVRFIEDIYARDARILSALNAKPVRP